MMRDREAWHAAVHGSQRVRHNLVTEQHKKVNSKANKITRDKAEHSIIKIQSSKVYIWCTCTTKLQNMLNKNCQNRKEKSYSWETSRSLSQQCTEQLERKSAKVQKTSMTPQSTGSNQHFRFMGHSLSWWRGLCMKLYKPCHQGHPRWTGHSGEFWQNVVHRRREWQTTPVLLPWEPHEQHEKAKRYDIRRWSLEILQARLQQYKNQEFPDVPARFRKGRRTTDQIANICWILEKPRESQRNIYFCFIDYIKAFDCVDHNNLWKILQEMGIPDHLTCLLRNPYARSNSKNETWNNGLV